MKYLDDATPDDLVYDDNGQLTAGSWDLMVHMLQTGKWTAVDTPSDMSLQAIVTPPCGGDKKEVMPTIAEMLKALAAAKQQYPDLTTLPLALTTGKGPYQSETYLPNDPSNPKRGTLNIELRSAESMNPALLSETVASEAIHGLQQSDPIYRAFHTAFVQSMTKDQLSDAHRAYTEEVTQRGENRPFNEWVNTVQAPEYIRGYLFPNVNPGWTGAKGEGQYTDEQQKILARLKQYMVKGAQQALQR